MTARRYSITFLATLWLSIISFTAGANKQVTDAHAWNELRNGRAIAIMRHALAPGTSDPAGFDINDCATQRNLSDDGRAQARSAGDLFRSNGIELANVVSSQWCRCMETAELLDLAKPQAMPALNSFFDDRSTAQAQTDRLQNTLPRWLNEGSIPTVLVTHQVNISALTGSFASSGEILIITLTDEKVQVLISFPTPI